jgi:hypothetical protein
VNAPQRPRKDDVRRFCKECSWKTGRLVERTSPALERQREQGRARSAARTQRKREQQRQRQLVTLSDAAGRERELDVRAELRRALTSMGYFDGWLAGSTPTMDDLNITIRRGQKHHHSGRAILAGFDVWFTFGSNASYEGGLELIYHEAAHLASPITEKGHGARFHRILADAIQERWPFVTYGSLAPNQPGGCWAMGQRVIRQLEAHTRAGGEL